MPEFMDVHEGMEGITLEALAAAHQADLDIQDSEGVNFEGPAPRPMDRARVDLDPTGKLVVDTSKLYMDDPRAGVNQFNDTGAYLPV